MKDLLKKGLDCYDILLPDTILEQLLIYLEELHIQNQKVNLTAIRDKSESLEKHFLDSLMLLKYFPEGIQKVIDVGTGAGFPGLVLAIACPHLSFSLVDSIGKKTAFLSHMVHLLELKNVEVFTGRAEDYILKGYRNYFDIGLCRAVGELRVICEYLLPFLKEGGSFLSQKVHYEEELKGAQKALEVLSSRVEGIFEDQLPFSKERRVILEVRRFGKIEEKYPRRSGVPLKKPL